MSQPGSAIRQPLGLTQGTGSRLTHSHSGPPGHDASLGAFAGDEPVTPGNPVVVRLPEVIRDAPAEPATPGLRSFRLIVTYRAENPDSRFPGVECPRCDLGTGGRWWASPRPMTPRSLGSISARRPPPP